MTVPPKSSTGYLLACSWLLLLRWSILLGVAEGGASTPSSLTGKRNGEDDEFGQSQLRGGRQRISTRQATELESRIVGGHTAEPGDFPFFVRWTRGCGASLIHPDTLLTAAHCYSSTVVAPDSPYVAEVEGFQDGNGQKVTAKIINYLVHPDFNNHTDAVNNNAYDLMLLQLDRPITHVKPVSLNADPALLEGGDDLSIIGYGMNQEGEGGVIATALQEATVQYRDSCEGTHYISARVQDSTMFCANGNDKFKNPSAPNAPIADTCQGDSGGPILFNEGGKGHWLQVGVTSWGHGCARRNSPGIYARTSAAYDWIQEQLCTLSIVPPPHCATQEAAEPDRKETLGLLNPINAEGTTTTTTTTTITTTSLRVDIHYDDAPQEISWALANIDTNEVIFISRGLPVTARNQRISQELLSIAPGTYRLEVYNTIMGDGIQSAATANGQPVIQVSTLNADQQQQVLWTHDGAFAEMVRADLVVA